MILRYEKTPHCLSFLAETFTETITSPRTEQEYAGFRSACSKIAQFSFQSALFTRVWVEFKRIV